MRKDFYLFRHGETDYNLQKRWQGQGVDIDLNDTGKTQAQSLAKKLADKGLEIIYSSPLKRAKQTAEIIAQFQNIPIVTIPSLIEGNLGDCEGELNSEMAEKYPDIWNIWYNNNQILDIRWPNGESKREIQQRVTQAFYDMLSSDKKIIGVASHGAAIRCFLLQFGYLAGKINNTAIFHLIYDDNKWELKETNL